MFSMFWELVKWLWGVVSGLFSGVLDFLPPTVLQLVLLLVVYLMAKFLPKIIDLFIKFLKWGVKYFEK